MYVCKHSLQTVQVLHNPSKGRGVGGVSQMLILAYGREGGGESAKCLLLAGDEESGKFPTIWCLGLLSLKISASKLKNGVPRFLGVTVHLDQNWGVEINFTHNGVGRQHSFNWFGGDKFYKTNFVIGGHCFYYNFEVIVQTCEIWTKKFGLYNHLKIYDDRWVSVLFRT